MIIERGIAMPPSRGQKMQEAMSVARQMQVGDSVYFEGALNAGNTDVQRLINAGKKLKQGHATRQLRNGVRVWRTE